MARRREICLSRARSGLRPMVARVCSTVKSGACSTREPQPCAPRINDEVRMKRACTVRESSALRASSHWDRPQAQPRFARHTVHTADASRGPDARTTRHPTAHRHRRGHTSGVRMSPCAPAPIRISLAISCKMRCIEHCRRGRSRPAARARRADAGELTQEMNYVFYVGHVQNLVRNEVFDRLNDRALHTRSPSTFFSHSCTFKPLSSLRAHPGT